MTNAQRRRHEQRRRRRRRRQRRHEAAPIHNGHCPAAFDVDVIAVLSLAAACREIAADALLQRLLGVELEPLSPAEQEAPNWYSEVSMPAAEDAAVPQLVG